MLEYIKYQRKQLEEKRRRYAEEEAKREAVQVTKTRRDRGAPKTSSRAAGK